MSPRTLRSPSDPGAPAEPPWRRDVPLPEPPEGSARARRQAFEQYSPAEHALLAALGWIRVGFFLVGLLFATVIGTLIYRAAACSCEKVPSR